MISNLEAEKDYALIHCDDVYNVFRIHNKKAANELAKNTRWLDEMNSEYSFEYYSEFTIFYFISENNKLDKVARCIFDNKFVYFDKDGIETDSNQFLNIIKSDYEDIDIEKYIKYLNPIFVAGYAGCPIYIMAKLSNNNDSIIRERVASNPNCPVELLWKLSDDIDFYVKFKVIKNINCPIEILEKLSNDADYHVRGEVARSLNCPVYILENLSNDKIPYVRYHVLHNSDKISKQLLERFSNDEDSHVRSRVAGAPNCPVEILEKLSGDVNSSVRKIASSKLFLARGS